MMYLSLAVVFAFNVLNQALLGAIDADATRDAQLIILATNVVILVTMVFKHFSEKARATRAHHERKQLKRLQLRTLREAKRNTAVTVKGFRETNNFLAREKKWLAAIAAIKSPAEAASSDKVNEIQATGEDTNERVKEIEQQAAEVAEALKKKDAGQ